MIENIFYNFLWKGPDRIKRNVMIQEIDKGGLKIFDLKSSIEAQHFNVDRKNSCR